MNTNWLSTTYYAEDAASLFSEYTPFDPLYVRDDGQVSAHVPMPGLTIYARDPAALRIIAARLAQAADMLDEAQRAQAAKKAAEPARETCRDIAKETP